jgi:hypothetical protein
VTPELMSMKHILVLNDEAHHYYRQKLKEKDESDLRKMKRKRQSKTMRLPGFGFPTCRQSIVSQA